MSPCGDPFNPSAARAGAAGAAGGSAGVGSGRRGSAACGPGLDPSSQLWGAADEGLAVPDVAVSPCDDPIEPGVARAGAAGASGGNAGVGSGRRGSAASVPARDPYSQLWGSTDDEGAVVPAAAKAVRGVLASPGAAWAGAARTCVQAERVRGVGLGPDLRPCAQLRGSAAALPADGGRISAPAVASSPDAACHPQKRAAALDAGGACPSAPRPSAPAAAINVRPHCLPQGRQAEAVAAGGQGAARSVCAGGSAAPGPDPFAELWGRGAVLDGAGERASVAAAASDPKPACQPGLRAPAAVGGGGVRTLAGTLAAASTLRPYCLPQRPSAGIPVSQRPPHGLGARNLDCSPESLPQGRSADLLACHSQLRAPSDSSGNPGGRPAKGLIAAAVADGARVSAPAVASSDADGQSRSRTSALAADGECSSAQPSSTPATAGNSGSGCQPRKVVSARGADGEQPSERTAVSSPAPECRPLSRAAAVAASTAGTRASPPAAATLVGASNPNPNPDSDKPWGSFRAAAAGSWCPAFPLEFGESPNDWLPSGGALGTLPDVWFPSAGARVRGPNLGASAGIGSGGAKAGACRLLPAAALAGRHSQVSQGPPNPEALQVALALTGGNLYSQHSACPPKPEGLAGASEQARGAGKEEVAAVSGRVPVGLGLGSGLPFKAAHGGMAAQRLQQAPRPLQE